jgi:hypothetical protein
MAALITEAVAVLTLAWLGWGARKLTGENLKVVWAELSTLSFVMYAMAWYIQKHALA